VKNLVLDLSDRPKDSAPSRRRPDTKEVVMKYSAAFAFLILVTTTGHAMSVMTNATGPYNYTCDDFAKAKPAQRALALAFARILRGSQYEPGC
jgi:hypothetical protein